MAYEVRKVEVWAADILNKPGMLARVLESLKNAGAQLEFVLARRAAEHTSRVFIFPLEGERQRQAAADMGLVPATGMHALRLEGADMPGLGAELSRVIADRDINLRGVSAAVIGERCVAYFSFDNAADLDSATHIIRAKLESISPPKKKAVRKPLKKAAKKSARTKAKKSARKTSKKKKGRRSR